MRFRTTWLEVEGAYAMPSLLLGATANARVPAWPAGAGVTGPPIATLAASSLAMGAPLSAGSATPIASATYGLGLSPTALGVLDAALFAGETFGTGLRAGDCITPS